MGDGRIINNINIKNPAVGKGCRRCRHPARGALVSFFLSSHPFTGPGVYVSALAWGWRWRDVQEPESDADGLTPKPYTLNPKQEPDLNPIP